MEVTNSIWRLVCNGGWNTSGVGWSLQLLVVLTAHALLVLVHVDDVLHEKLVKQIFFIFFS